MEDLPKDPKIAGLPAIISNGRRFIMRMPRVNQLLRTGFVGGLALAVSSIAFAVPPIKANYGPDQVFEYYVADCGTFDVLWDGTIEGHWKLFFDKDGNWTKYFDHYSATNSTYYNSEHPEIFLHGGPAERGNDHYIPGKLISTGILVKITIPGHGVVVHEAGRVIFDTETWEILVQVGPSDVNGDTTALCEALAH
jgi:hypothetical protein